MRAGVATLGLLTLWACGPIPVAEAEQVCISNAQMAQHPRGQVALGMDSSGHAIGGLQIGISSDYLTGRDPDAVYNSCVMQRSGQMPSRPFSTLPEAHM
ncbi:MAG: hypothetical protein ABIV25_14210 [Paracoccaceae bacterium]